MDIFLIAWLTVLSGAVANLYRKKPIDPCVTVEPNSKKLYEVKVGEQVRHKGHQKAVSLSIRKVLRAEGEDAHWFVDGEDRG